MRCDSTGDLYPIMTKRRANFPLTCSYVFNTLSSDLWNSRLGHPEIMLLVSFVVAI